MADYYNCFEVIENTDEAKLKFAKCGWGHEDLFITQEQLNYLLEGKCLAWCDGEYTHSIRLNK